MPPLHRADAPDPGSSRRRGAASHRRRPAHAFTALLVAANVLVALGCNRGPARAALAEADEALAAARPALERYLPEELARLEGERAEARARLAEGRYTDSLRIAQRLPGRIAIAASQAEARRFELGPAWKQLGGSIRLGLDTLGARLDEIASRRRWPRGFAGEAGVAEAKAELASAQQLWKRSQDLSESDPLRAVELAREAQAKLEALAAKLTPGAQPAVPPAVAATAAAAPPATARPQTSTPAAARPATGSPLPESGAAPGGETPLPAAETAAPTTTTSTTLAAEPPPPEGER